MNNWKLTKQCQADFDNGLSRADIYEKYSGNEISAKRLAKSVATIQDFDLIKKYKVLNYFLVGIMTLILFVMTFSLIGILQAGELKSTLMVITILSLFLTLIYGISKNYHQAYLIYGVLVAIKLPSHIEGFGNDLTANIFDLGIALFLLGSLFFLKTKLFPYMSLLGGPKKDADGSYSLAKKH